MASRIGNNNSKVTHRKEGAEIIFSVEGDTREYTVALASADQVAMVGPDLNELIWAVERAWRNVKQIPL